MLLRFPNLLVAVAAAALLLAAALAMGPLFVAGVASESLNQSIADSGRFSSGFSLIQPAALREPGGAELWYPERDRALRALMAPVGHVGEGVFTIMPDPVAGSAGGGSVPVRLLSREGAAAHVRLLEGSRDGFLIADTVASTLGLSPGDNLELTGPGGAATIEVAGIYQALVNAPITPFWAPLLGQILPPLPDDAPGPPFVVGEASETIRVAEGLGLDAAQFKWEFPIATSPRLAVSDARSVRAGFQAAGRSLSDEAAGAGTLFQCSPCGRFGDANFSWGIHRDIERAEANVRGVKEPVELLTVAGVAVALVVVGAAAAYSVHRRRTEIAFLNARGMGPATVGLKVTLESLLPTLMGAVAGYLCARLAVEWLGPGAAADASTQRDALVAVSLAVPGALLLLGCVAAGVTSRSTEEARTGLAYLRVVPWELAALVAAGVVYNRLTTQDGSGVTGGAGYVLLFPVTFIAGLGGLAARAFRRLAARVRDADIGWSAGPYLAVNRLAGAGRLAVMLVTAAALATGVFFYAETMATSLRATTHAKAAVFVGGDAAVQVDRSFEPPEDFPLPSTVVHQLVGQGDLTSTGNAINILAVDTGSFARVAQWDASFGDVPLEVNARKLRRTDGPGIPVMAVGDIPEGSALEISGATLDLDIVDRPAAVPGMFGDDPWIVVSAERLSEAARSAGAIDPLSIAGGFARLWVRGDQNDAVGAITDLGFPRDQMLTTGQVLTQPRFLAVTRTFALLRALGAIAAMLVVIGILLHLQARARSRAVSYALARRMGLAQRSHVGSLAAELGGMLFTSALIGIALGAVTAFVLYPHLDPLPSTAPDPLLRIPLVLALPTMLVIVALSLIGALSAHRAAERTSFSEVMRGAV